jgi:hypothetical protein
MTGRRGEARLPERAVLKHKMCIHLQVQRTGPRQKRVSCIHQNCLPLHGQVAGSKHKQQINDVNSSTSNVPVALNATICWYTQYA